MWNITIDFTLKDVFYNFCYKIIVLNTSYLFSPLCFLTKSKFLKESFIKMSQLNARTFSFESLVDEWAPAEPPMNSEFFIRLKKKKKGNKPEVWNLMMDFLVQIRTIITNCSLIFSYLIHAPKFQHPTITYQPTLVLIKNDINTLI